MSLNSDYIERFITYLYVEKNASDYTMTFYKKDIATFAEFLQSIDLDSFSKVTYYNVRVFLTTLYNRKLSRKTVSRTLSSLRTFYKFLERESLVETNPFVRIPLPKQDKLIPDFFYEEELSELFQVNDVTTPLGQRNQALLELLYATGIRVSECQSLTLDQIDFNFNMIKVIGKGNKERYVPFGQFAEEALSTYINEGRKELLPKHDEALQAVFLNARGSPLTTRGIRYVLEQMIKQTSLTVNIHPHKFRHTFATHMLNEGADLRSVQELLGHENLSTTQIYTHVTKDRLRRVYMNSHPRAKEDK
ncbi:MAG TPA: tyrosine recombinase XerC [Pseudogracilibacillus sp.]|nr:tyrosine recombinase XerC [Pseudogracilibacillus sp.]